MLNHQKKVYAAITVIIVAVILLVIATINLQDQNNQGQQANNQPTEQGLVVRHVLNGQVIDGENDFFPIAIMFDNSYDVRPQYGLGQADIVYEALAEGNITRLMGIFDSRQNLDKIGPVRSARPYFMDWAQEYGAIYMHVGGSPTALSTLDGYNLYNIDQIGVGEIYFWRDNNLDAPHNVFTSSSNWLRAGEIKEVSNIDSSIVWPYTDFPDQYPKERSYIPPLSVVIDFSSELYQVEWKFNKNINLYQRWQGDEKHIYDTGEQIAVKNILVQVVESKIIDDLGRRSMNTEEGGKAWLVNPLGFQEGEWRYENGRTNFYTDQGESMQLVPGRTWVEVVPSEESFIIQ